MIQKVTHVTLFVDNQDKALDFYVNTLGFQVHTDAIMQDGFRWLTICTAEDKNFEISLMPATNDAEKALVGKQGGSVPFLAVAVADCQKAYQDLKAKGVEFLDEPVTQPWGVSCSFKDVCGNILYMVQNS